MFTSRTHAADPAGARRSRRLLTGLASLSVLMLAATGCANSGQAGTEGGDGGSNAEALDKIVIATPTPPGTPAGIPVWIGEENGYFEAEGLDVEVVTFPGRPSDAVATVVAGQSDLVISVPDALIVPTANGDDQGLSWVFTPYQAPSFVMATLEDSDIQTAADLAGKTVAMPSKGAPFETFMAANIEGEGGDPSTVSSVAVTGNAALESLRNGAVDSVVLNRGELAVAELVTGIDAREIPLTEEVKDGIAAGFMMRTDASDEEKDVYERYLRAYLKSVIFAQENPEEAVEMSWSLYPESKPADQSEEEAMATAVAMLDATTETMMPAEDGGWGFISEERWQQYVEKLGLSEKLSDVTGLYDNSLLEGIADFDEDAVRQEAANHEG